MTLKACFKKIILGTAALMLTACSFQSGAVAPYSQALSASQFQGSQFQGSQSFNSQFIGGGQTFGQGHCAGAHTAVGQGFAASGVQTTTIKSRYGVQSTAGATRCVQGGYWVRPVYYVGQNSVVETVEAAPDPKPIITPTVTLPEPCPLGHHRTSLGHCTATIVQPAPVPVKTYTPPKAYPAADELSTIYIPHRK